MYQKQTIFQAIRVPQYDIDSLHPTLNEQLHAIQEHNSQPNQIQPIQKIYLKPVTIVLTILINIMFMMFLLLGCSQIAQLQCSLTNLPMISYILKYRYYDRVYVYAITFYAFGIYFSNIRAFYTKFANYFDPTINEIMYWVGLVGTLSCSWVGIIDMDLCDPIHSTFAVLFYISTEVYFMLFVSQIKKYGMKAINQQAQKYVEILDFIRWLLLGVLIVGLICAIIYGPQGPTPYFEWIGTLIMLNFFTIAAILQDYAECVMKREEIIQ